MDSQKAKKITKDEFVSLVVHRLQTPLAAIAWYAEILLTEDLDNISESQRSYIEKIIASNRQMMELVSGLLNVSAYEEEDMVVESVSTDVIQIARKVVKEFDHLLIKRGISIDERYGEIFVMETDPKLVEVIFHNLISNAVKYSVDNSEISVSIGVDGGNMNFKCVDKGIGIPKNQQGKLFTKLFRADNAKQSKILGAGLGLYIVKKCVDLLDGKIEVESEEGEGAIFTVEV